MAERISRNYGCGMISQGFRFDLLHKRDCTSSASGGWRDRQPTSATLSSRIAERCPHPRHIHARWLIPIGLSVSVPGILLYSQLDRIVDLRLDIAVLDTASVIESGPDCPWIAGGIDRRVHIGLYRDFAPCRPSVCRSNKPKTTLTCPILGVRFVHIAAGKRVAATPAYACLR